MPTIDRFMEGLPYLLGGLGLFAFMALTPVYFVFQVHVARKLWKVDRWVCLIPAFVMVPASLRLLFLVPRGWSVVLPGLLMLGGIAGVSICVLVGLLIRDNYRKP